MLSLFQADILQEFTVIFTMCAGELCGDAAFFDGKSMEIKLDKEGNFIEAVYFEGERIVDFALLSDTSCMVFTMAANAAASDVETKEEKGILTSTLKAGYKSLMVSSPKVPVKFDDAIEKVSTSKNNA